MARVVAFVPDLLFGSRVLEAIRSAGHEPVAAGDGEALAAALPGAQAAVVDLTDDAVARTELVAQARPDGVRVLGFYSHVEADVRRLALEAGFELVVPRSRMAREGAALVARLVEGEGADDRGR
jgi:hypothetical protein